MATSAIKRLAGETAIYGMSTIVARVLNFMLVPLYSRILTSAQYGVVTEFLAYIAVLLVVLTLGLETGCFRFASKPEIRNREGGPDRVFSSALSCVSVVSFVVCGLCIVFFRPIAAWLHYSEAPLCVIYTAGILLLDSVTSILFARLRYEHKAFKFATLKTVKICCELGFNLLLFLVAPPYLQSHPESLLAQLVGTSPGYSFVLFSIFLSCVVCTLFFLPQLLSNRSFRLDKTLLKPLLFFSIPLMLGGLPGILNDFSDRLLFRFCIPGEDAVWQSQMGVYQAGIKLAVLINLFIQMFRYAAEPFFFGQADQKDAPRTYVQVLNYFTGFCMFIYLGLLLFKDVLSLILGPDFREGAQVLPVMALAYVILGIYFNVSIWYKLTDKTWYAIVITLAGLFFTLVINLIFLPRVGYMAAAYGHLVSYLVMLLLCVLLGRKHAPYPYEWKKVLTYILLGVGLYGISTLYGNWPLWSRLGAGCFLILVYLILWALIEKFRFGGILRRLRR